MTDEPTVCAECGASGRLGTCAELFHALLALDLQRLQPWGRFHGLNVACYLLQHRSEPLASALDGHWHIVTVFLADGLDAMNALQAELVRANRHGARPWNAFDPPPAHSAAATVTIEDTSLDGTFPAAGYEQRMLGWARSVETEYALT
jgi:hypothetical protein